ncbi:hypothetical protein U9M48_009347 [Paspalum notatum var. saurae]|uniref:Integrase catalytic domain-containing protein n=1 Tax=Paspalum notatum var. saurae TaxID=547442 RepID=A0AAQ3WEV0_PASNO
MTGRREDFAELDTTIIGMVKFRDGSRVLRTSIASLGQLDERDCEVMIKHGILPIHDRELQLLTKRRSSFVKKTKYRAGDQLELVHGNLCRPFSPVTHGRRKYFLLLVDYYTQYMWLHLLWSKDETPEAIKHFQAKVEAETGNKLKVLRTNHGGEFTSVEFGWHCMEEGMERHLTALYSPQQNIIMER